MFLEKFNQFTVFVPQIAIHSGTCGTNFHTGRSKILLQPVIAKGTFIGDLFHRMNEPASIRTCLNTIPATDTVFFINKNNTLRTIICCTYRTNLNTGRFGTMVTHFRDKKGFKNILIGHSLFKTINSAIR